jgi:hypothetical protein
MLLFAVLNWNRWGEKADSCSSPTVAGSIRENQRWLARSFPSKVCGFMRKALKFTLRIGEISNGKDAVDAVCPKDAELALVVTAEVDEAAAALTGTG